MTVYQDPRNGVYYNWTSGDAGYGTNVNNNLLNIGLFSHISVIDMTTTAPPGSPSEGDSYVVATGGSGYWNGEDGNIAIWARPVTGGTSVPEWIFLVPKAGWTVLDISTGGLLAHNGTIWSTNSFTFTFV